MATTTTKKNAGFRARRRRQRVQQLMVLLLTTTAMLLLLPLPPSVGAQDDADGDSAGDAFDSEQQKEQDAQFKKMFDMDKGKKCPQFKCTAGMTPVPKTRLHFSGEGGCSAMAVGNVKVDKKADDESDDESDDETKYGSCCDEWHACYQVCGSLKNACDDAYKACYEDRCGGDEKCNNSASMHSLLAGFGGCAKFDSAQLKACDCVANGKVEEKRKAVITRFYEKYVVVAGEQQPQKVVDEAKVAELVRKADTKTKMAHLLNKLVTKYPNSIKNRAKPKVEVVQEEVKEERTKNEEEEKEEEHIEL